MSDNIVTLKQPDQGLTPRNVLEEALQIADDLDCIVVVGKHKNADTLLLGISRGQLHEQIGLLDLAKFYMMVE